MLLAIRKILYERVLHKELRKCCLLKGAQKIVMLIIKLSIEYRVLHISRRIIIALGKIIINHRRYNSQFKMFFPYWTKSGRFYSRVISSGRS